MAKRRLTEKRRRHGRVEPAAAETNEILTFLTEVMRDREDADLKTRMKAAELLGKRESLFEKEKKAEENCRAVIVDDLP